VSRILESMQSYVRKRLPKDLVERFDFWRLTRKIRKSGRFDCDYYVSCNPDVLVRKIKKSRLFDSDYYVSRNPDVLESGLKPIHHYILEGAKKRYDPSPLFCSKTYMINHKSALDIPNPLLDFLNKNVDAYPGAYKNGDVFRRIQKKYYDTITINDFADRRKEPRPWAVFLQYGPGAICDQWLTHNDNRPWDLIVNKYQDVDISDFSTDIEILQTASTKSVGIHNLITHYPAIVDNYDYLLLLDDDLLTTEDDITRLFKTATAHSLQLAQASLTEDSTFSWPVFFKKGSGVRQVNMVEIMMPLISKSALEIMKPLFNYSVSGWGVDFVGSYLVREKLGGRIGVIDDVSVTHAKQILIEDSAFYTMLYDARICPIVELRMMKKRFGVHAKTEAIELYRDV